MAQTSTEVVVAANGQIYVGPVGAPAPDSWDDALAASYTEVGFVSEDGATITDSKEIENISAWQSFYPIRRIVTSREFTVSFAMRQWNAENIKFAFGGGTVSAASGGGYKFVPPQPDELDERSLVLDWQDGDKHYRLFIPRGMATEATEVTLTRTAAADLAITFAALSDGVDPAYTLFTDDPAFVSTS
jgi:hypothetical protein